MRLLLAVPLLVPALAMGAPVPDYYVRAEALAAQFSADEFDESARGGSLALGTRWNDFVAVEVFYTDLGRPEGGRLVCEGSLGCAGFAGEFDARTYGGGLNLRYPVADTDVSFGGVVGIHRIDLEGDYSTGGFPGAIFEPVEQSETHAYLGIQLAYTVSPTVVVLGRWTRYNVDDAFPSGSGRSFDPTVFSFGIEYHW